MPPTRSASQRIRQSFFDRLGDDRPIIDLFDHLPAVYFFIKDTEGRFIAANRALQRLLGVSEDEIVGKTDDDFFEPELADAYRAEDREAMTSDAAVSDRVWVVPDRNGTLNWFVSHKSPLRDRAGESIGVAGAMQDVQKSGALLGPYEQMSGVIQAISKRYDEKLGVDELAELAHLSTSQFTRRFNKLFNTTPARYLTRVRINAACSLLIRTDLDLAAIALRCGFHDASHFVKQFKSHLGTTPNAYRNR